MMKCEFFTILLQKKLGSIINMVKKKKEKKENRPSGFLDILGFKNFFANEKLGFLLGILLFLVAGYLTMAFISYFTTGAADQSLIEMPREGEVMNEHHEFSNTCGSVGAYASWYFIKRCFGFSAFFIPIFLFLVSIHLIKAYRVNLLKWFMALMILMIWCSVTFSKFLSPFFSDACYNPGGDHGLYIQQAIENLLGAPGLTAILALTAIAFLTYLSAETIFIIRKILNPSKFIDKVKFKITNNDPNEPKESYEDLIKTEEDPTVFDDPATQTVEFKSDGKAVVIDDVYNQEEKEPVNPIKTNKPIDDVDMKVEVADGEETADSKTLGILDAQGPYDPKKDLENYHYPTLDLLKKYGQKILQILPLNPTGYGDSPYSSFSAFAGEPLCCGRNYTAQNDGIPSDAYNYGTCHENSPKILIKKRY